MTHLYWTCLTDKKDKKTGTFICYQLCGTDYDDLLYRINNLRDIFYCEGTKIRYTSGIIKEEDLRIHRMEMRKLDKVVPE